MSHRRTVCTFVSLGLTTGFLAATPALAGAESAPAPAVAASPQVLQSVSPAATPANQVSSTPASSTIDFNVGLQLSDPSGAAALARAVTDPKSPTYRQYLTAVQWEKRFSPAQSSVKAVTSWLEAEGITVDAVSSDRMTVQATAPASAVERAFATTLAQYRHEGHVIRLSSAPLKVPGDLASLIVGVTGVDQSVATPDQRAGVERSQPAKAPATKEIPQPPGFRNAKPCSTYYGKKLDTSDPPYGGGYPSPLPYAVCGYTPPQLQGAYGLTAPIVGGTDGKGYTVAVVDAYQSPTLFSDAKQYSEKNQPEDVLKNGQFEEQPTKPFNKIEECEASEWYGEQTLDVEAVHATAPGANILYVGAKNCEAALFNSVQEVVDGELANVISDSWGDDGGDLLDSSGTRHAFDNVLMMADTIGIGVQFSAGDEGDEFTTVGITTPDYPPSSPYATAVGGTSLQVGKADTRIGELGWSTSKSVLCSTLLQVERYPGCKAATKLETWQPPAPGEYLYGGGGGTSYEYPEPYYQEGVVPAELAARNTAITKIANRVEPDISMDADPTTGMLVGETQEFPNGTYYDEYRIGGTSLASPLFAGEMADADQAAGASLGFVNPLLYSLESSSASAGAFYDEVPQPLQALVRVDYLDGVDAKEGTITSVRTLEYEGKEVFCSGTGNCTRQKVALNTAPGFDSMTGLGSPGNGLLQALAEAH